MEAEKSGDRKDSRGRGSGNGRSLSLSLSEEAYIRRRGGIILFNFWALVLYGWVFQAAVEKGLMVQWLRFLQKKWCGQSRDTVV